MSKDTNEPAHDKDDEGADLVVPSVKTQRDKWNINATAYALAAKDPDSLDRFYQEHHEIENAVREHESHHQAKGASISEDDATALAKRIKSLYLSRNCSPDLGSRMTNS